MSSDHYKLVYRQLTIIRGCVVSRSSVVVVVVVVFSERKYIMVSERIATEKKTSSVRLSPQEKQIKKIRFKLFAFNRNGKGRKSKEK